MLICVHRTCYSRAGVACHPGERLFACVRARARDASVVFLGSEQTQEPSKCKTSAARTRIRSCTDAKLWPHEHELIIARIRNCFRTNTNLFSHEHEIYPARTRNGARIAARNPARNATRNAARNCLHEISMRMSQAVSGFWGRSRAGRALANESGESIWWPFRAAILGGNSGAISRVQFRAGNVARAISRGQFRAPASFFRPPVLVGCRRRGGSLANGQPSPSPPPKSASPSSSPTPWSSSPSVVAAAVVVVVVADDGRPATADGLRRLPTGPSGSAHVVSFRAFGQER